MEWIDNILKAVRSLNRRGQHNWVKILCLGVGLAAGFVLIGKVTFENSFDRFFPSSDRIYVVNECIDREGENNLYPQTSGAVAPGLKRYAPQVEAATRYTGISDEVTLYTEDNKRLRASLSVTDSCFFDVFPFRVLAGDARQALSRMDYCMVPRSFAEAMGGDVLGKKLFVANRQGNSVIVGGVYEDFPLNSKLHGLQVLVSMPTLAKYTWDGSQNWVGNDRYVSYVLLAEGTTPEDLKPHVKRMIKENLPIVDLKKAGVDMDYNFTKLTDFHMKDPESRRMVSIMLLLAALLIVCAVMNYLLLAIGGITGRAKEMAVHKCYGAEYGRIYGMVFAESLLHLLLSVVVAGVLVFACKGTVEELTGASLNDLLLNGRNWILILVCGLILVATGLVPGWLYSHVPVMAAFRGYKHSHRTWKLLLLGLQFASACFLLALLFVVNRQHQMMIHDNTGYDYGQLAHVYVHELSRDEKSKVCEELKKLAGVEQVTPSTVVLTNYQSGDNIYLPDDDHEYMNVADLFFVGDGYIRMMGMKLLSGHSFVERTDTIRQVMVSRKFEERMRQLAHWDNAVGKQILVTSYQGPYTICGVYDDVRMGSIAEFDERPSVLFYSKNMQHMQHVLIKFHNMTPEKIMEVDKCLKQLLPDRELAVETYSSMIENLYTDSKKFRTTVMIGGLVALVIALIGLVGYTNNEVNRRHKEIAIRKVNGAQVKDVLSLFLKDILRVAIPSVVVGSTGAYFVADAWQQQFSEKAPLTMALFVGCSLLVLAIILVVVLVNCLKVAKSNPVEYLKSE